MSALVVALIIIVIIALVLIAIYNGLIRSKNRVDEAWSDINVQLKRRYDLIPNLVNSVKGYAEHESKVFEQVSAARSAATVRVTNHIGGDAPVRRSPWWLMLGCDGTRGSYPAIRARRPPTGGGTPPRGP